MIRVHNLLFLLLFAATPGATGTNGVRQEASLDAARRAYEMSDYLQAVQMAQVAAVKDSQNAEVYLLLTKSYLELQERDAAVKSAEKAVAIDPENSTYHEWLGKAYGEKADHAGWLPAISLAKKTGKEFEKAVQLDKRNFSAQQALIEFDCSAPGMVGGGEEKALPLIKELSELDAAEGHYAAGNCRRQKKDFAAADEEFTKALEDRPKSAELIYDIGDYAAKRAQPERLLAVADAGIAVAPHDTRALYYEAVALVLKRENSEKAELLLREYLAKAPTRTGFPRPSMTHYWLGRLFENQEKKEEAGREFEDALKLDPRNKVAQEASKRLKKN